MYLDFKLIFNNLKKSMKSTITRTPARNIVGAHQSDSVVGTLAKRRKPNASLADIVTASVTEVAERYVELNQQLDALEIEKKELLTRLRAYVIAEGAEKPIGALKAYSRTTSGLVAETTGGKIPERALAQLTEALQDSPFLTQELNGKALIEAFRDNDRFVIQMFKTHKITVGTKSEWYFKHI